ncbi:ribosome biogenesis GTPase Der [endosymbiont of Pachyrhynchus infernalis]|uniref:ribosome biogenesis GTPase Der n=1 Tax=endosymbiont of Pachyrhynchus infernalis TaxID=1971488 RepID=UPI000DC6E16F|nr:ribosome biogenesis GTPase Der [endosymbiont of Pachyrhynchus infernalis]BBA84793.1 GTPase Der [endosymbiont of Pachyrhynchus infernalis]
MKYDAIVSIIGRSNVGKSLLFNRLLKFNYSLISDDPGTTVDIKYNFINFKSKNIGFIDTAAILDFPNKKIYKKVFNQIIYSINNSNIILFIVDSSNSNFYKDVNLFKFLLTFKKKIFLIINKIDLLNNIKNEFNFINKEDIIYISSLYNKGIRSLINKIFSNTNNFIINDKYKFIDLDNNKYIKLSVIGKQNVGKSTLINSISNEKLLITSSQPGTTKDSTNTIIKLKNINLIFTDTAGIINIDFLSKIKNSSSYINKINYILIKNINKSNIIIFIIDITLEITNKDLILINHLIKLGKPIILLINKCDLLNKKIFKIKKNEILKKLNFIKFINIIFISALYKKNIKHIFNNINIIDKFLFKKLKTNYLNKILYESIKNLNHKYINDKQPKLKFCNIYSTNPIKIIIFGKRTYLLSNSYKKYISNCFYKNLNYKNIPISIIYKEISK